MSGLACVNHLWTDESAVTTAEYAFLLATFVLVTIVAFANLTDEVQGVVEKSSTKLERGSGMSCAP